MELASDLVKKGLAPCIVSSLKFQEKIHQNNNSIFFDIFFTCSVMSTYSKDEQKSAKKKDQDPWFNIAAVNDDMEENKSSSESPFTLKHESPSLKQKADSNSNQHYYIKLAQNERTQMEHEPELKLADYLTDWLDPKGRRMSFAIDCQDQPVMRADSSMQHFPKMPANSHAFDASTIYKRSHYMMHKKKKNTLSTMLGSIFKTNNNNLQSTIIEKS